MALVQNKTLQQLQSKRYEKQGSPTSPAKSYVTEEEDEAKKKKGGKALKAVGDFFEGIGYLGHRLGLSAVQTVENSVDWIASSAQMIFGNKSNADKSLKNDWLNYNAADDWYDPSEGWQTAADVASAVGGMGTTALVSLIPYAGPIVSGSMVFADAAGGASKEALSESGNYGKEEFAYSALEGGKELLLEKALGKIFKWGDDLAGAIGSKAASAAAGKAGKEVAETSIKSLLKSAGREVLAETTEEVISEFVSPYIKRATYKPNAENATADELAYVAFVSAISSLVMGGGVEVAKQSAYTIRGSKIDNAGKSSQAINEARAFVDTYGDNKYTSAIKNITDKLAPVVESGQKLNANQRRSLGELRRYQTEALFTPIVTRSAITAISNPEAVAAKLNQDGVYKMVDGKIAAVNDGNFDAKGKEVRDITADDITRGVEKTAAGTLNKYTVGNALAENDVLRLVAASDAAGRIIMNSKEKEIANSLGSNLKNQQELNEFLKSKSPEEKAALSKELGIQNIDDVAFEEFNAKAKDYEKSGKAKVLVETSKTVDKMKEIPESEQKSMPKEIDLPDGGTARFTDGEASIGVYRRGDEYIIYDFVTNKTYKPMTKARLDSLLRSRREAINARGEIDQAIAERSTKGHNQSEADIATEADSKASPSDVAQRAAREVEARSKAETIAKDKINGYSEMDDAKKTKTRSVIENALKAGISEKDATSYARVSARTGLDIVFDKEACRDGNTYYAGYYDPHTNSIVVNPETTKSHAALLIHELSHAIRSYTGKDNKIHYIADKNAKITPELWQKVKRHYADQNVEVNRMDLYLDEASAYYAEQILGTDAALDLLLGKKKTLKEKILSFFKGAIKRYSDDEGLSREARKFYRSFKKMFDAFEAKNQLAEVKDQLAEVKNQLAEVKDQLAEAKERSADIRAAMEEGDSNAKRFAVENTPKITAGMTDKQRYEILKDKKITAPFYRGEADFLISEKNKDLESKEKDFAKKAIVEIAEKLGITRKEINFKDVEVKILISKSNLKESITKEATPEQIAKLLPILAPTAESSIAIERHDNRYYFDTDTVYFDNLLGAYVDEDALVPVRFGLKHSRTGSATLYVVVDQNRVALENLGETKNDRDRKDASSDLTESESLLSSVAYSISHIVPFVNSKDLLRYLPDGMLNEKQRIIKWNAIAETIKYTKEKNDKKYAEYIEKGNLVSAKQMVASAAKAAGYTDKVYHGTKAFGFTEFDPEKSDDKRSLFAAGSTELAQTYSGKHGIKKLSDIKNIDGLSNEEVAKMLNKEASESYEGAELKTEYEIFTLKDVNNLITEVNDGIDGLQKVIDVKVKEYADKMAIDFNDTDAKTHSRLIEANELLKAYEYKRLSTPLYVLLHYTDAFRGDSNKKEIADLEYKIRLMNKLSDADTANGVVVKKDLDGYGVSVLSFDKAREELKDLISSGNYALYGNPGKQLVIDAKGQNWNNIKNWIKSAYHSTQDTYVKKDDNYYRLYDSNTDEQIFHGRIEINEKNGKMSIDSIHPIMVQKANNNLYIRSENMKTTRDIAKFAKDEGFDSVKFENLVDNGGNGESIEASDVYVYFNPRDLKSADPVTYDDNGKVIPLSERFNTKNPDIRRSFDEESFTSPTIGNVAKSRFDEPKPKMKEKIKASFISAKDKLYIEGVDELYGVEKYLKKFGGRKDAESFVQQVRASETIAQTMIGNVQYDVMSGDGTKFGEGI